MYIFQTAHIFLLFYRRAPGYNSLEYSFEEDNKLIVLFLNINSLKLYQMGDGISRILYDKKREMPKLSAASAIGQKLKTGDYNKVISYYYKVLSTDTAYTSDREEFNALGYYFLGKGKTKEAIEIFKINVNNFPKEADTYDSLGEAYYDNRDFNLSLQNYTRSLELDPSNTNAKNKIEELKKMLTAK